MFYVCLSVTADLRKILCWFWAALLYCRPHEAKGPARPETRNRAPFHRKLPSKIAPLLQKYCYDCHGDGMDKGGVALDSYRDLTALLADRKTWGRVEENLRNHVMPPGRKRRSQRRPNAIGSQRGFRGTCFSVIVIAPIRAV
jgi:hypothetical protein